MENLCIADIRENKEVYSVGTLIEKNSVSIVKIDRIDDLSGMMKFINYFNCKRDYKSLGLFSSVHILREEELKRIAIVEETDNCFKVIEITTPTKILDKYLHKVMLNMFIFLFSLVVFVLIGFNLLFKYI